jgi:hypothetical protein
MLASLTFLSPLGALTALAAVLPLTAAAFAVLRVERVARALGLSPAPRLRAVAPGTLASLGVLLLGLAASQPAWRSAHAVRVRAQSDALYVVDVSRSMAAAPSATGSTRLAVARSAVRALHDATPDVPSGLAGMTDRVLPYLFATSDGSVFDAALRTSALIEAPPPQEVATNATSFASLQTIASGGYFDATALYRTCVLVTDAETRSYDPAAVAASLSGPHGCRLVVVRVGGRGERVYGPDGIPEPGYAPSPNAGDLARSLAAATGGSAFDVSDLHAAIAAVRADTERGSLSRAPARSTLHPLAPWLTFASLVLLAAFAAARMSRRRTCA